MVVRIGKGFLSISFDKFVIVCSKVYSRNRYIKYNSYIQSNLY